ncbi:unnamed protein product [Menidia menidia]|uniref:Transcription factor Spi-C n=1 Tax=Menidia menidia TaxID=238744 RepID=A0A8S4B6F1_9TELE|nr:unnamed protein product [Menidia menidia]
MPASVFFLKREPCTEAVSRPGLIYFTVEDVESQSDLEVILEFLEEYYRQNSVENGDKVSRSTGVPLEERPMPVDEPCEQCWTFYGPAVGTNMFVLIYLKTCKYDKGERLANWNSLIHIIVMSSPSKNIKSTRQPLPPHDARPAFCQSTTPTLSDIVSSRQSAKHPATGAGSGRKVRLFHFLFEMLEDPSMAHCLSWVPTAAGVFRFSSRNKDQVAALWGQRKGNKRPMTYQKMSRALRNYARSGEIFKVKKKLTYQFSRDTLQSLQRFQQGHF